VVGVRAKRAGSIQALKPSKAKILLAAALAPFAFILVLAYLTPICIDPSAEGWAKNPDPEYWGCRARSLFPGTRSSYSFKLFVRGLGTTDGATPFPVEQARRNRQGKRMFPVKGKKQR
jgi:hypothetical protein